MNLFKGLTPEQKEYLTKELSTFAKERHGAYVKHLNQNQDDEEVQTKTIAWEFLCQNLGIPGYEWS